MPGKTSFVGMGGYQSCPGDEATHLVLSGHSPTFSQGPLEKQVGVTFVISPHAFQSMRK